MLGEVDRLRRLAVGLSWRELAEKAMRPRRVVVPQVLGQHPSQVVLIDDQQPVAEFPAQAADEPFADRVCLGLTAILMPAAVNTASKEVVNWPARSLIRNLSEAARWPRSIRTLRAAWVVQAPSGLAVIPAR